MDVKRFVDARLLAFRDRTGMWGSNEAVELQALQLLEFEARSISEIAVNKNPRLVLDLYVGEVRARFSRAETLPLHDLVSAGEFGKALYDVCSAVRLRVDKVVGRHASVLARPERQDNLRPMSTNRLSVCLSSESTRGGSLPLKTAVQTMSGLRALFVSAARMEDQPAPSHLVPRKRDMEFGDACRLGQTELGSFVINIEIPSATLEFGMASSFSSRVMRRIMHGLCIVAETRKSEQLVHSYSDGMNANMLEAMLELKPDDPQLMLDFSSHFGSQGQSLPGIAPVRVAPPQFEIMEEGARQLRALSETREEPYKGRVRTLVSNTGQVNIDVDDGGRGFQLRAYLSPLDYRKAVRAHDVGKHVIIVGKKSLHGSQRWIDDVVRFDVVD
ncbi:hypothetical protein [Polyangium sorediatum]|uniref:Uncharacterized protein n=1 Tax=Polyangium sorediatum TaxID=889274 RepID=A0ABT6NT97_9BACT|nr:hypothetical protein [Polyangium sorediatum]MDI1431503.1 hypothetical protein [Polyangium sorediatum]